MESTAGLFFSDFSEATEENCGRHSTGFGA
jgi:hypothetical protein